MTIYRIDVKVKETQETRLVEAQNMSAAMRFVGQKMMTIAPLTTAEAVELGRKGLSVETANGKDAAS